MTKIGAKTDATELEKAGEEKYLPLYRIDDI